MKLYQSVSRQKLVNQKQLNRITKLEIDLGVHEENNARGTREEARGLLINKIAILQTKRAEELITRNRLIEKRTSLINETKFQKPQATSHRLADSLGRRRIGMGKIERNSIQDHPWCAGFCTAPFPSMGGIACEVAPQLCCRWLQTLLLLILKPS